MPIGFFQRRIGVAVLAAIVLATLFFKLGGVPLFDEDEGAYAEVSREMVDSGDWLVPHLEGKPFFHKPPLLYWTQALSIRMFGVNEFAVRFPSALASLIWALVLFIFVRRFIRPGPAWLAAFFLVTALQTSIITKAAIPDALLNLFITTTMAALFTHYRTGQRRWLLLAYAGMGLGFLTKGPVAIAIPVVVSVIFFIMKRRIGQWIKMATWPLGWLLLILIAAPWYIYLIVAYGMKFVSEIFLVHNLGRFQSAMEGHSGPIFYYLPVIIGGLIPYTTLLLIGLGNVRRHWQSDLGQFLLLWFLFVLIFFSLAETKLWHYIVYGYVPLLIWMALASEQAKRAFFLLLPLIIFGSIVLFLPVIAKWSLPAVHDEFSRVVISDSLNTFGISHILLLTFIIAATMAVACIKSFSNEAKIVITGLMFITLINLYLMPKVADIMQAPIKSAALMAKKNGDEVVMWRMNYPSFSVYLGHPVLRRKPVPGDVVVTKVTHLEDFPLHDILFQKYGIVLMKLN